MQKLVAAVCSFGILVGTFCSLEALWALTILTVVVCGGVSTYLYLRGGASKALSIGWAFCGACALGLMWIAYVVSTGKVGVWLQSFANWALR